MNIGFTAVKNTARLHFFTSLPPGINPDLNDRVHIVGASSVVDVLSEVAR